MDFSEATEGMRVFHTSRQDYGTVMQVKNGLVTVIFDTPGRKGPSQGVFDKRWFEVVGHFLEVRQP